MADSRLLVQFIKRWEGGFVNDPVDRGGATNMGVTIGTFRSFFGQHQTIENLRNITDDQWFQIFKRGFWDRWRADEIRHQSVANAVVDWLWSSGVHGIRRPQRLLNVVDDGIVGPITLRALNSCKAEEVFFEIRGSRKMFIHEIIQGNASQERFRNGWLNRINDLKFEL